MGLTVGTAGHVDHGKTALVRALTGRDTDRLPEEQRRGISIDLGYAPLELPDGRLLSLVDVPGHERFVRTMVAGASGIDLFLLVIDAAEGARAQTHEHLAILRFLGVTRGVVALTKADIVDDETLELAELEARELVPEAEVVVVSSVTGIGLDTLRDTLARAAADVEPERGRARAGWPARLHVDRVFTLHGIGTVITGTLWSGAVAEGDSLRLEPAGRDVRVRSVQVHDREVAVAEAGQRVALSLPGLERHQVRRGDVLVAPDSFPVSYRLDVVLEELEPLTPLENGARLVVHHGTSRSIGRVIRRGAAFAQLRLATPVVAARGDRIVLRVATTVGGARVLDPAPARSTRLEQLELLEEGTPAEVVRGLVGAPVRRAALARRAVLDHASLQEGLAASALAAGDWVVSPEWLAELQADVDHRLRDRAERSPLEPGLALAELLPPAPWAPSVLGLLKLERREGMAYAPGVVAALGDRSQAASELLGELERAGGAAVKVGDRELARFLETGGALVRLGDGFAIHADSYRRAVQLVEEECAGAGRIGLARFRDLAGIGRRDAQLLLERMDADGLTRRVGEQRVLRRR